MRTFMVLSFIAVVSAGRLGYDYQLGVSGSAEGPVLSGVSGSGSGISSNFDSSASVGSPSYSVLDTPVVQSTFNKEFYLYSAPEEEFYNGEGSHRALSSIKKNLRVVFIKAPENNGLNNAALQLARQASEDRTAIYVLSKQPDISELANQVQQLRESVSQKPEVRFIKYRTAQDAANAQRAIQQQYDALGGSSHTLNEGIAPVLNFASDVHQSSRQIGGGGDLGGSVSASNLSPIGLSGGGAQREYLPPIVY